MGPRYIRTRDIRQLFWHINNGRNGKPRKYYGKSQNDLPADVRCAFCDFVEHLARDGAITENLAQRATL
jgi:hypothetical protein